jgi:hypothetical protein
MTVDDRTPEQKQTHTVVIAGNDRAMTNIGRECGMVQRGGQSIAAWACRPGDAVRVEAWVKGRNDLTYIRVAGKRLGKPGDHVHIYVVDDQHPAIGAKA